MKDRIKEILRNFVCGTGRGLFFAVLFVLLYVFLVKMFPNLFLGDNNESF